MVDNRFPRRGKQYKPSLIWATTTEDERRSFKEMAQATADAPTEEITAETVQVLSDENVGSHLLRATTETWRTTVASLRESGKDGAKMADAVTSMLRSANQSPSPGEAISIELQGGTETDVVLDAIQSNLPPECEVEYGTYSRKTQTARKSGGKATTNGAARTGGKKKGTPKECACGCGDMTGGGTFRPGHDARHKGNLLRRIDEGGEDGMAALEELRKYPNLTDLDAAEKRLGSGPAKKAAQAERLARLKEEKAAAAAASDDEESGEDNGEEEDETESES